MVFDCFHVIDDLIVTVAHTICWVGTYVVNFSVKHPLSAPVNTNSLLATHINLSSCTSEEETLLVLFISAAEGTKLLETEAPLSLAPQEAV